jgi:hypothetical protein
MGQHASKNDKLAEGPGGERPEGVCVFEIVRSNHLPNMDTGSLTDAYVVLTIRNSERHRLHQGKLKTLSSLNWLDPWYHSYQAVSFQPVDEDIIHFEVIDEDVTSKDDKIGVVEMTFGELRSRGGREVTACIDMTTSKKNKTGEKPTLTFRLVHCGPPPMGVLNKQIFAIRHGESKWNQSQSSKNVKGLVSQYDHELTAAGIAQAVSFNERWKECQGRRDRGEALAAEEAEDLEAFLSAQAIFVSPLTRATQTALLTCEDHPKLKMTLPPTASATSASPSASASASATSDPAKVANMTLLRNLREVKNMGSFDSVGCHMGEDIPNHVRGMLERDMGKERCVTV